MDLLSSARLSTDAHSRGAEDRADVVGLLDAGLGVPDDIVAIGEDSRAQRGTVVAADADHH